MEESASCCACGVACGTGAEDTNADLAMAVGRKSGPGHDPENEVEPEEPDGGEAVVVGDAFGEEAGDVLVVEIEPGPAAGCRKSDAGGESDGRIAERGEDVPGSGDEEEDGGACEEMEFEEEMELFGDREVEQDEGDGEDESDEALGEDVEGHDGGEGEAGEEWGRFYFPTLRKGREGWGTRALVVG